MNRNNNNNNRKLRKRRNKQNGGMNIIRTVPFIPRNLKGSFPFPETQIVKLTSILNFAMQGAATFVVNDYRLNSLYQFNVTGGTTHDFSGDTQLAAIYDSYHVQDVSVSFQLCGNEAAQPVFFGLIFKDDQPSVSVTNFTHAVNALEVAPTTGPIIVGQTTGMETYRSKWFHIPLGSIVGNATSYASDLSYTSSFGNFNPTQAVWMGAIAYAIGGNITNGIIVSLRTELTLRVYSIKTLQE